MRDDGAESVLGRRRPPQPEAVAEPQTHCTYCEGEIGQDEERVDGIKTSAHRRCVDAKLDKLRPGWREMDSRSGNAGRWGKKDAG